MRFLPGSAMPDYRQKFSELMLAFAVTWVLALAFGKWLARRDDQAIVRRRRHAELCARADRQHAAVLAGDDLVGVFGDYPPSLLTSITRKSY